MPRSKTSKRNSTIREERKRVMEKLDTLQQLLHDATSRQALESHKLSVSFQAQTFSIGLNSGIGTNDLPYLFAKLWIWGEPDEGFFRATHPAVVKLRQDGMSRWKESPRWNNCSERVSLINYEDLRPVDLDLSLFPQENESWYLCQTYLVSCDWNYELVTEAECNDALAELHCYQQLGLIPTKPEQWTRIALVLAICRLTLSCLAWVGAAESDKLTTKRSVRMRNWCDLSVMALCQAGFDQNPTVEALRVLLILISTVLFETDCGQLVTTPQIRKLHRLAIDASERLNLHREPPASLSPKVKDDRRRMWWTLVILDSYYSAGGKTFKGPLAGSQNSDTKYPAPQQGKPIYIYAGNLAYRDLRSARIRFEMGRIHNRYSQLLTHRRPLATSSELWKLDRDLVELELSVLPEQRLISDLDLKNFSQWQSQPLEKKGHVLRYAQQTFYIVFWLMRAEIHRGLLYREESSSHINIEVHRDIVSRSSYCMLHLYRNTKLPTAYLASIASATLTVLLELLYQPLQRYDREIRTLVSDTLSRLQTEPSPVIGRACQVIEYFFDFVRPHVEVSEVTRSYEAHGPNKTQKINLAVGFVQLDPSRVALESYPEASKPSEAQVLPGLSAGEITQTHPFGIIASNLTDSQEEAAHTRQSEDLDSKIPTVNLRDQLPDMPSNYDLSMLRQNPDTVQDTAMKELLDLVLANHFTCMQKNSEHLNTLVHQSDLLASSDKPLQRHGAISPSTIPQDSAMKELLDFVLANHSTYMQKNSEHLETLVHQSNRLSSSEKPSQGFETQHNVVTSSSKNPRGWDEVNPAYPVSNPTNHSNSISSPEAPIIELTNPAPEVIPIDLSSSFNQGAYFQYKDKDKSKFSTMDEIYDPLMSGSSNSLWENLGIRQGSPESSFSNGTSDSAKSPASKILTSGYLSHQEFIHPSTITKSNFGSKDLEESEIPRRAPAAYFQSMDTSSAKQVNYFERNGNLLGATGLEQGILNEQGHSGDLVPFSGDMYEHLMNNSFKNIHK